MRYFHKLAQGVDIIPLRLAIAQRGDLWNQNKLRTTHPATPHKEVDDIWLRFNDLKPFEEGGDPAKILDEHESINYLGWYALPQARAIIFNLMARVEGIRLGRVLITRMAPGTKITPHVDGGTHAAYYERYHIAIQSHPGAVFYAGDEQVQMADGEVWWFDNGAEHSVSNNSDDDRITLIVDIQASK